MSYDQYRADAIGCAKKGYFRDITNDAPAKRFIRSFELADRALNDPGSAGGSWIDHVQITRPDRQKRDLQALHVSDVEKCLLDSGYKKLSLKKSEMEILKKYPAGSQARHRYLYDLSVKSTER